MKKGILKYEEAVEQLETIVNKVENGDMGLDELCESLKKAQTLIRLCRAKLTKTQEELEKMLKEDDNFSKL